MSPQWLLNNALMDHALSAILTLNVINLLVWFYAVSMYLIPHFMTADQLA